MRVGITGYQGLSDLTEMLVRGELWRLATTYGPYELVGVTALRPGPETWFAQAVREHGGKVEIVVPASGGALPRQGPPARSSARPPPCTGWRPPRPAASATTWAGPWSA